MIRSIFLLSCLLLSVLVQAKVKPDIVLENFATGFSSPTAIRNDGVNEKLYVVQQNGEIYIVDQDGEKQPAPFLNITSKVLSGGERGLLGMAFHPDFQNNRLFVVNYTRKNDGATIIATYKATPENTSLADPNSEKILLTITQPFTNHNGGDLHFGADGYLYIGMGDGGSGGDPSNYAQNPQSLLGKMLRIHLDTDSTYAIPADNPYAQSTTHRKEIWAMGVRNPWRFSFDRLNDDLWIADVGQSAREEVNVARSPRTGGENYGWRCYEGEQIYNNSGCASASAYTSPVFTYNRTTATGGQSITGGYVYRGSQHPDLYGYYVCADYISRNFWLLRQEEGELEVILKNNVLGGVTSFGEDIHGELYAVSMNGNIYRVGSKCSDLRIANVFITPTSCPGEPDGKILVAMANTSAEYDYLWDNGYTFPEIANVDTGWYHIRISDDQGCVLTDSFEVKSSKAVPEIIRSGDSLRTDLRGEYQWYVNDTAIMGANDFYLVPEMNGSYQVEVVDDSSCVLLSDKFEWNINLLESRFFPEDVKVFPNPANDLVTIMAPEDLRLQQATIRIFDANGRVVFEEHHRELSRPVSFAAFPSGQYFIKIYSEESGFKGIARVTKVSN